MDQKAYIGQQIRALRNNVMHMNAEELGQQLDPPRNVSTITSWERGRTQPDAEALIQMCILFGVDISDFYYKPPEYATAIRSNDDDFVRVPLLGRIAAGEPIEMDDVDNTFPIPREVFNKYPRSFLLTVDGESMNRVLFNGSYALIDPCNEVLHDRAPYAVCVNGYDATIKRVHRLNNGFELIPDSNDPTYETHVYNYNEPGTMTITPIGEVVWSTLPYDWDFQ